MGTAPVYVLGIDGLPLGSAAAVAVEGSLHSTFALAGPGTRAGGVSQRVQTAVAEAEAALGRPPAEVRLVLIDDGGDGGEVAQAGRWLADRGISFQVLDLVGADGVVPVPSQGVDGQQARSASRATEAALW